jgi:very-short-patch-repair endonuclease
MRLAPTNAERKLWWKLRELNARGYHFRRQVPFRSYILDFAEHCTRVVIELDGEQHGFGSHRVRDQAREGFLAGEGYRVLRFSNEEVYRHIDAVVEGIVRTIEGRRRAPPTRNC